MVFKALSALFLLMLPMVGLFDLLRTYSISPYFSSSFTDTNTILAMTSPSSSASSSLNSYTEIPSQDEEEVADSNGLWHVRPKPRLDN